MGLVINTLRSKISGTTDNSRQEATFTRSSAGGLDMINGTTYVVFATDERQIENGDSIYIEVSYRTSDWENVSENHTIIVGANNSVAFDCFSDIQGLDDMTASLKQYHEAWAIAFYCYNVEDFDRCLASGDASVVIKHTIPTDYPNKKCLYVEGDAVIQGNLQVTGNLVIEDF